MHRQSGSGKEPIYLDGFATTRLAPESMDAMRVAWALPGNAGSPHRFGENAARTVAAARASIGTLIGAAPNEIVFTSGATEADNLAMFGVALAAQGEQAKRRRIIVSAVEHKAVLGPASALKAMGYDIVSAPVDALGLIRLDLLANLITDETLMVSVMAANNETGVIQPIAAVAKLARAAGALVHCDAAQAAGKIDFDVDALDVDYASLSAHKMHGPAGIGALYISAAAPKPRPLQLGGGQEQGLRSGTEPVALIAGFGAAAVVARDRMQVDGWHSRSLAERLHAALSERQIRARRTTDTAEVLPGALSLSIDDADADQVVLRLHDTVCLSTGSACSSGQLSTSHVLKAMGYSEGTAKRVIRIYCGRYNTISEIDRAADLIASAAMRSGLAPGELRQ